MEIIANQPIHWVRVTQSTIIRVENPSLLLQINYRCLSLGCLSHHNVFYFIMDWFFLFALLIVEWEIHAGFLLSHAWLFSNIGVNIFEADFNWIEQVPCDLSRLIHDQPLWLYCSRVYLIGLVSQLLWAFLVHLHNWPERFLFSTLYGVDWWEDIGAHFLAFGIGLFQHLELWLREAFAVGLGVV